MLAFVTAVLLAGSVIEVVNATKWEHTLGGSNWMFWTVSCFLVAALASLVAAALLLALRVIPTFAFIALTTAALLVMVGTIAGTNITTLAFPPSAALALALLTGLAAWICCGVAASRAALIRKAPKSPDGLWWWDGVHWRPTGTQSGRPTPEG